MEIPTTKDVERIVDSRMDAAKKEILRAIQSISKPVMMPHTECAEEMHVTNETALKYLKDWIQAERITDYNWDGRTKVVNREQFYKALNNE